MNIGIIGGGIAGLSTALALKKAGINFHLFEQSPEFKEIGTGILISTSCFYLLKQLGVGEHFQQVSLALHSFTITTHQFKKVRTIPIKGVGYSIHRAKLIEVLSKPLLSQQYTFNARVDELRQNANQVIIKVNGKTHFFDAVIAADGISSAIRNQFLSLIKPRYTQQTMWRAITTIDLPKEFKNNVFELWGMNKRFGIIGMADNQYFWFAVRWAKEGEKDNKLRLKDDLTKLFSDFHPIVKELIANGKDIIRTDLYDIAIGDHPWHHGKVAFVGDSIHASTPHLSQGACQAIESAYSLAACLKKMPNDIPGAFSQYQKKRTLKTKFITNASYRYGRYSHQRNSLQYKVMYIALKMLPRIFFKYKLNQTIGLNYLKEMEPFS